MNSFIRIGFMWFLIAVSNSVFTQDSSRLDKAITFPTKLFAALDKKTISVEGKLDNLTDNPALQKSLEQYKELQSKFNASENIKKYITQRRELLKQQFEKLGMVKELKQYRKQVYYYQQQVRDYKEMFEDPNKMEVKLMEIAMHIPQFKDFFAKSSQLGRMFALPGGNGANSLASLQGL